jgi:hypothetical protein
MSDQHHSNAANVLRSGAVGVCAAAVGRWRMSAMAQPHAVINYGKSRAHHAR